MDTLVAFIILVLSFYFLAKIVDGVFIKALDNIADHLNLPPSVTGATFMAAGTSAPELSTSLFALFLAGSNSDMLVMGLGTVVGSAIFQILVVIGFAALVKTSYLNWKPVIRDGVIYSISIILLIWVIYDGNITFTESAVLVGSYFVYLVILFFWSKMVDESKEPDPIELVEEGLAEDDFEINKSRNIMIKSFAKVDSYVNKIFKLIPDVEEKKKWTVPVFIFSLFGIAFASYFLVIGGEAFALGIGVMPSIVALTILAGGTSVPEMISSAIVAKEGRGDMAISNAIGSNVFDILMSLGLPLAIYTYINGDLTGIDSANITSSVFLLFATVIMVILLLASQKFKAGKWFGIVLIASYILYVIAAYAGLL